MTFAYPDGPPVVQDFSLAFREKELTAILGPDGSGKTTVLKLLRGLLTPQNGEVWQQPYENFRVGYVFQNPDYQLFAEEVWEEVAFGVRLLGLSPPEVEDRVEAALTRVHLLGWARDDPFSLTKGQRQRLAVASVLALAPRVIILDEPTTGLDHREQQDLLGLVRELNNQGHTVIMVTHSMWPWPPMPGAWWSCWTAGSSWTAPPGKCWPKRRSWPRPAWWTRRWCSSAGPWALWP